MNQVFDEQRLSDGVKDVLDFTQKLGLNDDETIIILEMLITMKTKSIERTHSNALIVGAYNKFSR